MATNVQVVIDCADPARLGEFWAAAMGYKIQDPPPGFDTWPDFLRSIGVPESDFNSANAVVDPDGAGPRFYFQRVPEPKTGKNRVHVDLNLAGGQRAPIEERRVKLDAEVKRLTELGATLVHPMELRGEYWIVMQDPEGNEFCIH